MKNSPLNVKTVGARLKSLRLARGYSMRELAARAGIAVSFLSKIEAGKASPTIMSLQKVLEALDVAVGEFFRDGTQENPADKVVFKREDMKALVEEDRTWLFAFPSHPDLGIELSYEEYKPRTRLVELERHPVDICGYVLAGELTLEIPHRGVFKAGKGDAFYLKAGTEHISRNRGRTTLKMVVAQSARRRIRRT